MLVTKVHCPRCGKRLRMSKPLAAGHRILCSGCNGSFAFRPEDAARVEEPPAAPATPPPAVRPASPPPAITPALPPARLDEGPDPQPVKPWVAVLGLGVLVGGLLLLAGGIAVSLHLSAKSRQVAERERAAAEAERARAEATRPAGPEAAPGEAAPVDLPLAPRSDPARPDAAPPKPPAPTPPAGPGAGPASGPAWLPSNEQKRVNEAIDRGIEYLKRSQGGTGTWSDFHPVGLAALPGLTLLECGVPRDDPRVVAAASYVRSEAPQLKKTYELSLCILFLDRLGEPSDRPLIQTMALRLIAGQKPTGGWDYDCPVLIPPEERELLTALQKTRPKSNLELFVPAPGAKSPPELFVPGPRSGGPGLGVSRGGDKAPPDIAVQGPRPGGQSVSGVVGPETKVSAEKPGTVAFPGELPKPEEKKPAPKPPPPPVDTLAQVHAGLSLRLKRIPALTPPRLAGTFPARETERTDNSNTQFATLGLWAAGRHEVPAERALALLVKRFRFSQTAHGGWNYLYQPGSRNQTPAMTGAGLLGLAVGHGLVRSGDGAVRGAVKDPAVDKAFRALGGSIGKPLGGNINLYFLWTLERVGVLYGQRKIQDKDWYAWGARLLVERQQKDGHWRDGHYPGSMPTVDTCFALLFLKRANLTQDLSRKLEFFVEGRAPETAPPVREQK